RHNRANGPAGRALLVCRSCRVFGSDSRGRVYKGKLRLFAKHAVKKGVLNAVYEPPPRRKSRREPAARTQHTVAISGEIDPVAASQHTKILVGNKTVAVKITYL